MMETDLVPEHTLLAKGAVGRLRVSPRASGTSPEVPNVGAQPGSGATATRR